MLKLLQCEWIKLKHSTFPVLGISGTLIVPVFVVVKSVISYYTQPGTAVSLFTLYESTLMFLMLLFAPIILTILETWIISREYMDGTLKNIFVIPVSQSFFLIGKLLFIAILTFAFMLISWLEILLMALVCNCFILVTELTVPSALFFLMKMLLGGILLCATQTPFVYLTVRTKGFVAPLVAIAVISLINVVLSNSPIAGYYPWSASWLLVWGHASGQACSGEVSIAIILLICLWGVAASLVRFRKEEMS